MQESVWGHRTVALHSNPIVLKHVACLHPHNHAQARTACKLASVNPMLTKDCQRTANGWRRL